MKSRKFGEKGRIVTSVDDLPIYIPHEEIADNLYQTVKILTEITPPRNYEHPESLDRVSAFITETFKTHGYSPQEQLFTFNRNIIASIGPEDAPRLVIGAHYDAYDEQPGADDNASGVAALLELAKLVASKRWTLRHRVDFAAYTLDRLPTFQNQFMGSFVHAHSLKESGALVKGMIALEMLGYFSDEPDSQKYPRGISIEDMPDTGNFITVVGRPQDAALAEQITKSMKKTRLPSEKLLQPQRFRELDFSGHWGFWALDFPAVMVTDTAFFRNPHYHQASDTIDTLDFDKMADVVQGISEVIYDGII